MDLFESKPSLLIHVVCDSKPESRHQHFQFHLKEQLKMGSVGETKKRSEKKKRNWGLPVLGICFLQLLLELDPVYEGFKIPYVVVQHHQHLLKTNRHKMMMSAYKKTKQKQKKNNPVSEFHGNLCNSFWRIHNCLFQTMSKCWENQISSSFFLIKPLSIKQSNTWWEPKSAIPVNSKIYSGWLTHVHAHVQSNWKVWGRTEKANAHYQHLNFLKELVIQRWWTVQSFFPEL